MQKTLEYNPRDIEAYKIMTKILFKTERYDEAYGIMKVALEEIPDNGDLYYVMAQVLKYKQMWAEYKECMTLAMENHDTLSIQPKEVQAELEKNLPQGA